jgi:long-subunit acyl-CoA synthetase (AMP-forming)
LCFADKEQLLECGSPSYSHCDNKKLGTLVECYLSAYSTFNRIIIQYVPLELAYPTPMIERVLADVNPIAICTTMEHIQKLPAAAEMTIICLDDPTHEELSHEADEVGSTEFQTLLEKYDSGWADDGEEGSKVSSDDLAFVVYLSGTTGQPKGIANQLLAWRFKT